MLAADPRTRPPRAWIAALLTLAACGLGHGYAGAWARAVGVASGFLALLGLVLASGMADDGEGRILAGVLLAAYLSWAMLDSAGRAARHPRHELRRFNHWYVYLAFALLVAASAALVLAGAASAGVAASLAASGVR